MYARVLWSFPRHANYIYFLSFCLYIQVSLNHCAQTHIKIILLSGQPVQLRDKIKKNSSAREKSKFHFLILHLGKLGRL